MIIKTVTISLKENSIAKLFRKPLTYRGNEDLFSFREPASSP